MRPTRRYAALALAVLAVLIGLVVVGIATKPWVPVVLVAFGVIATVRAWARAFLALLCAALVALLALIAFNVFVGLVIEWLPDAWAQPTDRLPIEVGLVLAVLVFGWVAYYYLRSTWLYPDPARTPEQRDTKVLAPAWPRKRAAIVASLLACAVILGGPPFAEWLRDRNKPTPSPVPAQRLEPRLDVVMIAGRPRTEAAAVAEALPPGVSVEFSVGRGDGRRVLWTRTGIGDPAEARDALAATGQPATRPPKLRERANAVIVLLVKPSADCARQRDRWEEIASAAKEDVGAAIPVVSLATTSDAAALACWRESADLAAVEELGTRVVTDAAAAAATTAAAANPYVDVAFAYRPILLFDADEQVPRPLSIEQMFVAGKIRQCPDLGERGTCETDPIREPESLQSPGMHLVIDDPVRDLEQLADAELAAWDSGEPALPEPPHELLGLGSSVYVNPVPVTHDDGMTLYLDYWWYLLDNPAGAAKRASCGAGLVIFGITCFDHVSDWEGVTVVLERSGDAWAPQAVHYAQHDSVVRYPWRQLQQHWDGDAVLARRLGGRTARGDHPVVFVANGTHASYAHRCGRGCRQVAADLEEGDHAGAVPWVGADDEICLAVRCLALLPTTTGGRGPASWNAFAGPWGRRHCFLRFYCDSGNPPAAPGRQDRYRDPSDYDGTADVDASGGGYVARPE